MRRPQVVILEDGEVIPEPPKKPTLSECLKDELDERNMRRVAKRIIGIATDEDARTSDSIAATKLIFERLEGAPKGSLDVNVNINPLASMDREQLRLHLASMGLAPISQNSLMEIESLAQAEAEFIQ